MFTAYSVAVRVSLVSNVTTGLLGLSTMFRKVHGDAAKLQSQLDRIKLTMAAGVALGATGFFGLNMIRGALPYGAEYLHQLQQMNAAGMKQAEIVKATSFAWKMNRDIPTQTTAESLGMIRELRAVMGSTPEALNALPTVAKLQAILSNVKGVTDSKGAAYEVAKTLDIRGKSGNAKDFAAEAQLMTKAIIASGGTVTSSDFFSTAKYGRTATAGWSADFLYKVVPTLIQEMKAGGGSGGAGGPGNALMSAYATVIGGQIAQKNLGVWSQLGLLDPSKIVRTKTGSTKGVLPGGVVGSDMFAANPFEWSQKILLPAMRRQGITDPKEQQMIMSRLFANRTAGFVMSQMALQPGKFTRDMRMIETAKGLEAYRELLRSDPYMAQKAFQSQWHNLLAELSIQILPALITVTGKVTDGIVSLTAWMRQHPRLTKSLVLAFTALSGAMAFGGTVLLLKGAFMALGLALRLLGVVQIFKIAGEMFSLATGLKAMAVPIASGQLAASATAAGVGFGTLAAGLALVLGPLAAAIALTQMQQRSEKEMLANPFAGSPVDRAAFLKRSQMEGKLRRFLGMDASKAEGDARQLGVNAARRSPYVKPAGPIAWDRAPNLTLNMDGRRVGEIVGGHMAKGMGGGNAVGGRHDIKVTPVAPAGVVSR